MSEPPLAWNLPPGGDNADGPRPSDGAMTGVDGDDPDCPRCRGGGCDWCGNTGKVKPPKSTPSPDWHDYLTPDDRATLDRADVLKAEWREANQARAGIVNRAIQRMRYAVRKAPEAARARVRPLTNP